MNRAVNSISLNIAEGAGKESNKAFDYYLDISIGSIFEVVSASFLSLDRGYISPDEHQLVYSKGESLGKSINAFRSSLHK